MSEATTTVSATFRTTSMAYTRRVRDAVWLVPSLWLAVVFFYFAVAWIVPYRTPPSWDECEFLRVTLRLNELLFTQPGRIARVVVDGEFCIWHASLAGSVLTLPVWWVAGIRYVSAYLAAVLQCITVIVLAGAVAWSVVRDAQWRMLAGVVAALCCALAPMTFALGSMVMSEVPSALLFCVALLVYLHTARRERMTGWALAGLAAYLTIYGRAERGIVFIICLFAAVWADTWVRHGWRAAVVTGAGYLGAALLVYLWVEHWLPAHVALQRGHVMHGALLALGVALCAGTALSIHEIRAARGPVLMMLVTVAMLGVWLTWSSHGTTNAQRVFLILTERSTHAMRGVFSCYVWQHMALNYSGNHGAVVLKAVLLAAGVPMLARMWPGGLVLLGLYALQAWKADLEVSRFLFHLHVVAALAMGCGAAWLARRCGRLSQRYGSNLLALGLAVICMVTLSPGVMRRGRHAFERFDATLMPTFDRNRALWQVLDAVTDTVTRRAQFSVATANPMAFSYQTLATHGRMVGRDCSAIGWPPTFEDYLTSPEFDYHIILGPGTQASALFYHQGDREQFEHWRRITLQSGLYVPRADRTFAGERVALSIVQRGTAP